MAKRKPNRRVPKYERERLLREKEAQREPEREEDLPPGAIAADWTQQAPNNSYSARLFYQDYEFKCVDCGVPQVWTAADQKWWYEVAKGSIYSRATRCRECRKMLRDSHSSTRGSESK